jgi:hypothetical protein
MIHDIALSPLVTVMKQPMHINIKNMSCYKQSKSPTCTCCGQTCGHPREGYAETCEPLHSCNIVGWKVCGLKYTLKCKLQKSAKFKWGRKVPCCHCAVYHIHVSSVDVTRCCSTTGGPEDGSLCGRNICMWEDYYIYCILLLFVYLRLFVSSNIANRNHCIVMFKDPCILIVYISIQRDATKRSIYSLFHCNLLIYSTCFGCHLHPSSGVQGTVVVDRWYKLYVIIHRPGWSLIH